MCIRDSYCITRKELAGIIFGLNQYRQYLLGRHFTIRTDHAALTYLLSTKNPIGQQARWMDFMSEFDFDIIHRAGTAHGNADSLSRKNPCERNGLPCRQCHKVEHAELAETSKCFGVTTRARAKGVSGFDPQPLTRVDGTPAQTTGVSV